jgi:hypothetical protein
MEKRMKIFGLFLFTLLFAAGFGSAAFAQCSPGIPCDAGDGFVIDTDDTAFQVEGTASCDSDFMNQIYAKAYLEADREVVINQTIIRKPDSILEYTCFDDFASMTAGAGGDIFSDTTDWRTHVVNIGAIIPWPTLMSTWMFDIFTGGDKLDASIERLVLQGLDRYIDSNFDHSFLGGTASIDSNISNSIGPNSYNCNFMDQVWQLAKCDNFGTEVGFLTFDELATNDPRQWPTICPGTNITNAIIDVARNDTWTFAAIDPVVTHVEALMPPGGAVTCGSPIPTGVVITRYEWNPDFFGNTTRTTFTYDDKVCSNPSCWYDRDADSCED